MLFIKFMRFLNMLCRVYTYFGYTKTKSDKSWFEDMIEKLLFQFGNDKITKFSQKPNYSTQRNIVQLMKAFSLTLLTYFIEYNSDTSSFKKQIGQFLWHFLEFELKIRKHSSIYYIHCKGIDALYCWRMKTIESERSNEFDLPTTNFSLSSEKLIFSEEIEILFIFEAPKHQASLSVFRFG